MTEENTGKEVTAKTVSFQDRATNIIKKLGSLTETFNTQRETREKMLKRIYNTIASMKLQYEDGEFIVPTTEAELATAIEILKKTDNKEKAELTVLYNAINGSGLEGAGGINNLDDLSSFIAQTNRTLKNSRGERDAIYKAINGSKLEGAGSIDNFSALSTFITNTKKNIDKSGQATTDIYDTIQKSNLPGADQVITGNKTSVENYLMWEISREDNNTIEECQKHFMI